MKYFVILLFLSMLVGFAYAYELVPAGIEVIEYGIFDKDGNVVHQLRADQPYQINVHFESELDVSVSFTYHVQILDKNKHWTEPVEEFNSSGILQPNEEKTISFEWIPKYDGKFRTLVGFGNNEDDTAIGSVPQYDFEVASEIKPSLKQFSSGILFNEIQCNDNLILIQKYDGSPACVKPQTLQKLRERGWAELPLILEDEWVRQPALSINNHDPSNLQTPVVRILDGSASPESQVQLDPKTITIVLGINNTVTWINEDLTPHTLTSNENSGWSTRIILPEKNATVIFNHTGIFEYHGTPHPWITGKVIVLENEKTVPPKSVPLTLFPVTPQNVTLPNSKKILTDTTMISINKINQITITNSDPNGQKTHPAQITIKSVTLHSKGIESLPAQSGINILVFDYSIQSKDKDAFYATLDFEMQFGTQTYATLLNGDEFSTPLLPDQKRDSSFIIQIGKNVNEITIAVKDQVTKKTLWAIPLDLTPFNIKYRESSGILIQENEN